MVMQLIVISMRIFGKLNLFNMHLTKLHSSLSYAFSKSILSAIYHTFPLVLPILWIISWTIIALSTPFLLGTKAIQRISIKKILSLISQQLAKPYHLIHKNHKLKTKASLWGPSQQHSQHNHWSRLHNTHKSITHHPEPILRNHHHHWSRVSQQHNTPTNPQPTNPNRPTTSNRSFASTDHKTPWSSLRTWFRPSPISKHSIN